ncbi:MAG TPA: hypothetical protein VL098_03120 [Flavipsychrobacter sp.]|nr:hypothetical protein [Flavipsychrobacter sp.]
MKAYFRLQLKIMNRRLSDFGVHPALGYLILSVLFVILSELVFRRTVFAPYLYVLVGSAISTGLGESKRNDFLKLIFHQNTYRQLRIIENALLVLPFSIFLLYKGLVLSTILLMVLTSVLALLRLNAPSSLVIPTPFNKRPFEFLVGFRNVFPLVLAAYGITLVAIRMDNFNLGVFALGVVFLTSCTFYLKPENEYYVWVFRKNAAGFLLSKFKTALGYVMLLSLPIAVALASFYPERIPGLLLVITIGSSFLLSVIAAKYASYPNEMNVPHFLLVAICISFPPLMVVLIPYFFMKSLKRLKSILG